MNGRVDMTTNGGGLWTQVGSGTLPGRQVTRIAIDATNSNNVYVTNGGYQSCRFNPGNVWPTTNAGTSWTDISGGLPAIPVIAVTIHPNNHNFVYIGTTSGVFDTETGLAATPASRTVNTAFVERVNGTDERASLKSASIQINSQGLRSLGQLFLPTPFPQSSHPTNSHNSITVFSSAATRTPL